MKSLDPFISEIIKKYSKGSSLNKLAREYRVNNTRIKSLLLDNSVQLKTQGGQRRLAIDEDFFESVDTEEKAYWVGFILADGCVRQDKTGRWQFSLTLQGADVGHLKKLRAALGSEHAIIFSRSDCIFSISSKKLCHDLINIGIIPNKTYTGKPALVPGSLKSHYFRGLIDGDGCISLNRAGMAYSLRLFGTYAILHDFSSFCGRKGKHIYKKKNQSGYEFRLTDKKVVLQTLEILYGDCSVYLDRKHAIYQRASTRLRSQLSKRLAQDAASGRLMWVAAEEVNQIMLPGLI